jgi:hypothetical protein
MQQLWLIANETYGPFEAGMHLVHGTYEPPVSVAFFCPHCGEIWGRRIILQAKGWWVATVPCEECHRSCTIFQVPGSVLTVFTPLKELPKELLKREALLHYF